MTETDVKNTVIEMFRSGELYILIDSEKAPFNDGVNLELNIYSNGEKIESSSTYFSFKSQNDY